MDEIKRVTKEFKKLLSDKTNKEQKFQDFLESNSMFIPMVFIQNHQLHMNLVLRKVQFGNTYKSDFFYLSKSTTNWNAIHVEIEDPSKQIFNKNDSLTSKFNQALQQIESWKGWLVDLSNQINFNKTISIIKNPMPNNPINHKFVLVYGRRDEINTEKRRQIIESKKHSDIEILTYDSLLENPTKKRHMGYFINSQIKLFCECEIDAHFISFNNPKDFLIPKKMKSQIIKEYNAEISNYTSKSLNSQLRLNNLKRELDELKKINNY